MKLSLHDIVQVFAAKGDRAYAGEGVNQREHALQSAQLAEAAGANAALITAALLHDIGHLLNDQGETPSLRGIDDRHEMVAIPRLRALFDDAVLAPIRLHVTAKRYLCARGDDTISAAQYRAALSVDSVHSLALQGGPLDEAEADAFIAQPYAHDAVRLRRWDDQAKVAGRATPPLDHYLAIVAAVARA
jgi:phosphonate degradation associated HDIG domain protein